MFHIYLSFFIFKIIASSDPPPTCQPPNIDFAGMSWYPHPINDPYVFYTLSVAQRAWPDAEIYCNQLARYEDTKRKTNLARIMNEFENEAILETVVISNRAGKKIWIAGNGLRENTNNTESVIWRWLQNNKIYNETLILPLNYTNWGPTEPQNTNKGHDSIAFVNKAFSNFQAGEWFSRKSQNEEYFVCEYRCAENDNDNNNDNSTTDLIFSSGEEWLIPNNGYEDSLVGAADLPPHFSFNFDIKLYNSGSRVGAMLLGTVTNGINSKNKDPRWMDIYFYTNGLSYLYLELSGSSPSDSYCAYNIYLKKNFKTDTVYNISYKFYSDSIEVYMDGSRFLLCQPMQSDPSLFDCALDYGGNVSSMRKNTCVGVSKTGFLYEARARNAVPIYAGVDLSNSSPSNDARVRNIEIYRLND